MTLQRTIRRRLIRNVKRGNINWEQFVATGLKIAKAERDKKEKRRLRNEQARNSK